MVLNHCRASIKIFFSNFFSRPEKIFLILSLFFGFLSAILTPQISIADEGSHFQRAYDLSEFRLTCKDTVMFPEALAEKLENARPDKKDYSPKHNKIDFSNRVEYLCLSASGYSPILYIPQTIGIWFARIIYPSPDFLILMSRLFAAIFYSVSIFFIIKFLRLGKWLLVVLALSPQLIHSAASLSTDCVNNIAIFLIIAFLINLFMQKEKLSSRQTLALFGLALLAALTKQNNILLFFPLIFLPTKLFKNNKNKKIPFNLQKWAIGLSMLIIAIGTYYIWQKIIYTPTNDIPLDNPLNEHPFRFLKIIFNTYLSPAYGDFVLNGIFGGFSSFQYSQPISATWLIICLILISLLFTEDYPTHKTISKKWVAIVFSISTIISISAITYILYSAWALRLGPNVMWAEGVQGRYFTALLLLLVPIFLPLKHWLGSPIIKNQSRTGKLIFVVMGIVLIFYIIETVLFIQNGYDGSGMMLY
jgi:uncharacterized membrane protein